MTRVGVSQVLTKDIVLFTIFKHYGIPSPTNNQSINENHLLTSNWKGTLLQKGLHPRISGA